MEKISAKQIAKKVSKLLKTQNPDYDYLREVFRFVRKELNIEVTTIPKRLPYVPIEEEVKCFYNAIWKSSETKYIMIIKVLLIMDPRKKPEKIKNRFFDSKMNQKIGLS